MSVYTCESCAPEGLSAEEYSTRPIDQRCIVCNEAATRWYCSAERVLIALLKERKSLHISLRMRLPVLTPDDIEAEALRVLGR